MNQTEFKVEPQLKRCPFCGSKPELRQEGDFYCVVCSCDIAGNVYENEQEALKFWNERA